MENEGESEAITTEIGAYMAFLDKLYHYKIQLEIMELRKEHKTKWD
jgi:hypothetical protein